jgi:RNA polymerase nonessential primary-like sigma factor
MGGRVSSPGLSQLQAYLASTSPTPRSRPRRTRRRFFYAIRATEAEIHVPPSTRLGYLRQSRLIERAKTGDTAALQAVWISNARLAFKVINRYRSRPWLMADLFQEAQLAMSSSIYHFDVASLNELSTYAFVAMRRRVVRHRVDAGFASRLPAPRMAAYHRFRELVVEAASRPEWFDAREAYLDRNPVEYGALLGMHRAAVFDDLDAARDAVSPTLTPLGALLAEDGTACLRDAILELDDRQRHVLVHRFGLDGRVPETLDEVAVTLSLTKERVRQIQNESLALLRELLELYDWTTPPPPHDR